MRSIRRQRTARRRGAPRIEISQAEITADLHYPAAADDPALPFVAQRATKGRGVAGETPV